MTTLLKSVLISVTSWTGSMTTVELRADGLRSALKFSTMNKIRMLTLEAQVA